jgi:hypothetical protein
VDYFLEKRAALVQRAAPEVMAPGLKDVEGEEQRWRAEDAALVVAQQTEPADQLLVIDRYLTVQDESLRGQLRYRRSERAEPASVVDAVAGDQPHAGAVAVGAHAIARRRQASASRGHWEYSEPSDRR